MAETIESAVQNPVPPPQPEKASEPLEIEGPGTNGRRCRAQMVVVAQVLLVSALVAAIIAVAVLAAKPRSAALGLVAEHCCLDGGVRYQGKCYYFSEDEGNWTDSQSHCSALGASLAGIDTPQEMAFLLRYTGSYDHWVGLRQEQNQPWKWTNGTKFNHWFEIRGGGDCAYLNEEKGVSSLQCYLERQWVCRKAIETGSALGGGSQ
ncbi:C-type lectin domain family 2 member B-like [Carettochelys insculpta]|uniref:C-type lectin domain family 2 member B-like n=1 Tax=Carettochelys insculpta TaxID=44489 RepID=UPI003EB99BED